jgi:hypothetical protein
VDAIRGTLAAERKARAPKKGTAQAGRARTKTAHSKSKGDAGDSASAA